MRRKTRKLFLLATILLVLGGAIFAVTMSAVGWDFAKLQGGKNTTKTYEIDTPFDAIQIKERTTDIHILPSIEDKVKIEIAETESDCYDIKVVGDVLKIEKVNQSKWYQNLFDFTDREVRIYLPKGTYENLDIVTDTGDVRIEAGFVFADVSIETDTGDILSEASASGQYNIQVHTGDTTLRHINALLVVITATTGDMELEDVRVTRGITLNTTTGEMELSSVRCAGYQAISDTGDMDLTDVVVSGILKAQTETGDVEFDACDADEIYIRTDTGDVEGTLLSEKIFNTLTDTGKVMVPFSTTGGKATIQTDTGDIIISIKP